MKPIHTPIAIRMEFVGFHDASGGRTKGSAQDSRSASSGRKRCITRG